MKRSKKLPEEYGVIVRSRPRENVDKLVARFKRMYKRSGLQTEVRENHMQRFMSRSEKKRMKKNRAKRRALKNGKG
jgi:ribosomal protein S21